MKKPIALTLLYGGLCVFLYFLDDLPVGLPPVAGAPPRVVVVPPDQPEPEPTEEPEPEPRPEPDEPEPRPEPDEPEPDEPEPRPEPAPSNAVTVDDSPFPPAPSALQSPPERGVTASNAVTVDDSPFPPAPSALQSLPGGSGSLNYTATVDDSPFPAAPSASQSESGRSVSTDNAATVDDSPFPLVSDTGRRAPRPEVLIELDDDNFPNRIGDPCPPAYPPAALRAGIEGTVVLMLRIDRAGVPEVIDVLRSIPVLDDAAIEAAHQCRYEPMTSQDGNPVAGVGPWEVEFLVPTTSR